MRKNVFFLALAGCLVLLCAEAAGGRKHRAHADSRLPYGSPWMQKLQNAAADRLDLSRMDDRDELRRFIDGGRLVKIDGNSSYGLETVGSQDPDHADLYAYARPWVKDFLDRELAVGAAKYGVRFKVTSLVRTKSYQHSLCHHGGSGAICGSGWWKQSSHLTGSTVDITRKDLDGKAAAWLEARIAKLAKQGKVIAIKEGDCYHVMVLPSYVDPDKAETKHRKHVKRKRAAKPAHRHRRHKARR